MFENMTDEQLEKSVSNYLKNDFKVDENYIFVSYSHHDKRKVLESVYDWINQGYNVYLDIDFENHGSDDNWITLMEKRLRSDLCVQICCFRSTNYYSSYASLIELLTMRSDSLLKKRGGNAAPIEIIEICSPQKIKNTDSETKDKFKQYWKENKCEEKGFWYGKQKEKELLIQGLNTLYENEDDPGNESDECAKNIEQAFTDSYVDFYNAIYRIFEEWFEKNDMNGNYKTYGYDATGVFDNHEVYKHEVHKLERKKSIPSAAEEKHAAPETDLSIKTTMDNNDIDSFETFLSLQGLTNEAIAARKSLLNNVQKIIGRTADEVVSNDDDMYEALLELKKVDSNGRLQNALRKYYSFVNNKDFPRLSAYKAADEDSNKDSSVIELKADTKNTILSGDENYTVDGVDMTGNQSKMIYDVFEKLVQKYPNKAEELTKLTSVSKADDVSNPGKTTAKPLYFRAYKGFEVVGIKYYVGASFSRKDKINQIMKMIDICGENEGFFTVKEDN